MYIDWLTWLTSTHVRTMNNDDLKIVDQIVRDAKEKYHFDMMLYIFMKYNF